MRIRTRLLATFCLVALATLGVSTVGYVLVGRLSAALNEVGNVRLPSIRALLEMREALDEIAHAERLLHPSHDGLAVDGASIRDEARRSWERFAQARDVYAPLPQTAEEAATWQHFLVELAHASPLVEALVRGEEPAGPAPGAPASPSPVGTAVATLDRTVARLVEINAEVADHALGATIASGERIERLGDVVLGLSAVAVLLQFLMAVMVARATARPIEEVALALQRMASGERGVRVPETGDLEVRALTASANKLAASLQEGESSRTAIGANLPSSFLYQIAYGPGGERRYLSVSASVERLTGIRPLELLADPTLLDRFVCEEDRVLLAGVRELAEEGKAPPEIAIRGARPGEPLRDFLVTSAPRRLPDGTLVSDGIVTDVTERKRTERALAAAGRALRAVNRCRQAVVHAEDEATLLQQVCDVIVQEGGYSICWVPYRNEDAACSVAVMAHAGWGDDYFTGRRMSWADEDKGRGPVGTALRTGERQWSEDLGADPRLEPWREQGLHHAARSMIAFPLVERGRPFGALAVYSAEAGRWDPAEVELLAELAGELEFGILALRAGRARDAAEAALRSSGTRMRLALDMSRLVYFEVDMETGRIHFGEGFREIFGWPEDDSGGVEIAAEEYARKFILPEDAALLRREMEKDRAALGTPLRARTEHRIRRADGSVGYVAVNRVLEDGPAGRATRLCGAIQDITESEAMKVRLAQSQKMEAVGQLAGGVAHDFNNYLTVILGYAQMLLSTFEAGDRRRARVEEILKAAEHSAALTSQLLAFSRREVLAPRVVDLNALLRDTEKMLRRLVGEDVQVRTELAADLDRIWADPGQLQQVVVNLAVNARDAMPRGGTLSFETTNVELDDTRASVHASIPRGSYVRLAVRDSGTGIAEDVQKQMFEPFFTTKGPGRGTGLGLSVVYGIVQQSGGYIDVESRAGEGATFLLYFPSAVGVASDPAAGGSVKAGDLPRGSETLLLVEDEPSIRELARDVLAGQGYHMLVAVDGEDALGVVAEHPGEVDLVVTDVVMPRMSGAELAASLRRDAPGLKVLFVSGYTDDAVLRQGIARDEVDFLQKPYSIATLVRRVRELLDEG